MTNNIHDFTNGCRQNISIGILWNNIYNHKVGVGLGKGVENEVDWYLLIAKCKLQACFCGYMIWKAQASFSPFHPKLKYVTNGTSPSIFMSTGWTPNWSSVCGYKLPKRPISIRLLGISQLCLIILLKGAFVWNNVWVNSNYWHFQVEQVETYKISQELSTLQNKTKQNNIIMLHNL